MPTIDALFAAASVAREKAYAPYSKFPVGCALINEEGALFSGCNVENAAYPQGVCAETSAISALVAGGGRKIREILVVGAKNQKLTPCGACRQRIAEFATPATKIHCAGADGSVETFTLAELLPRAFGPATLATKD